MVFMIDKFHLLDERAGRGRTSKRDFLNLIGYRGAKAGRLGSAAANPRLPKLHSPAHIATNANL